MNCRACKGKTKNLFSFGGTPPDLVMCVECTLVQLKDSLKKGDPDELVKYLLEREDSVVELPYIGSIVSKDAFDAITPKHGVYYSLKSLEHLLERYGMALIDVKLHNTSITAHIKRIDSVIELRKKEEEMKLDNWGTFFLFTIRHRKAKQ